MKHELTLEEFNFLRKNKNLPCLCYCTGDNKYFIASGFNIFDYSVSLSCDNGKIGWVDEGYYKLVSKNNVKTAFEIIEVNIMSLMNFGKLTLEMINDFKELKTLVNLYLNDADNVRFN